MYLYQITRELDALGMSPKVRAYGFCRQAIHIITQRGMFCRIDEVYEEVARNFSTTVACVERNIRYGIERTWGSSDPDRLESVFGLTVRADKGKPTNREFLFLLADRVIQGGPAE